MKCDKGCDSAAVRIMRALVSLRRDQRGTIAVMMALLFPALIGILGLGMEVTNWYMRTRGMRQFSFCFVFFLGLFWVIDVLAFEGQNSAGAWQQVQRIAQKFSSAINDQVGQIWR